MTPLEVWYSALDHPFGLKLTVADPDQTLQELYKARRQAKDPRLSAFHIRREGNALMLTKNLNVPEIKADGDFRPLLED